MNTEEMIERMYWEFDHNRSKNNFSERDCFKAAIRKFLSSQNERPSITLTGAFVLGWITATIAGKTRDGIQSPGMYVAAKRFARKYRSKEPKPEDAICPVCGYLCLGNGGFGCIDKPGMMQSYGSVENDTL